MAAKISASLSAWPQTDESLGQGFTFSVDSFYAKIINEVHSNPAAEGSQY
jgi:hypothetical protein